MAPLFDMFAQAQNGKAIELMAQQFGLAQEQMTKATAALLPAFSAAFKRNTANPYDFGALLTALGSGNYAKYFEDMSQAFTPQGMVDGNGVLGQLFGSKEMSRAIAAQAAQVTGISQEIYKQMLPVMADTLMGGLFKQTTGQFAAASDAFANNPMAAAMRQWMEAAGFDVRYVLTGMRDAPSGIDRERFRWAYTEVQRQAKVRHEKLTADASLDLAWRFYDAIGDLRAVPRRR